AVAARELGGGGVGVLVAAPESVEHVAGERIGVGLASRCQVRADRSLHRGVDEGGGDEQGAAALACGGEGIDGGGDELLEGDAGFGDERVGSVLGAEDGTGDLEQSVGGVGTVTEGGGGCDRGEV